MNILDISQMEHFNNLQCGSVQVKFTTEDFLTKDETWNIFSKHDMSFPNMKYINQTWNIFSNHGIYFPNMKYIFQTWNIKNIYIPNIAKGQALILNSFAHWQQRNLTQSGDTISFPKSLTIRPKVIKDLTMGSTPGCLNVDHYALYFSDDPYRDPNMNNKEHRIG